MYRLACAVLVLLFLPVAAAGQIEPHKAAKVYLVLGVQVAATSADMVTSQVLLERPRAIESNPFFGSHPSPARLYGTAAAITALQVAGELYLARHGHRKAAMILGLASAGVHTFGAVHNGRLL